MKAHEIKSKLIDIATHNLEGIILELRGDIKNMLRGEGSTDEGGFSGTKGDYSAVGQENYLREQAQINRREAEKHENLIQLLKGIETERDCEEIGPGCLVYTNRGNFLIAHAVRPIELEGKSYILIGPEAPIYKEMRGKTAGNKFTFRQIDCLIESVL